MHLDSVILMAGLYHFSLSLNCEHSPQASFFQNSVSQDVILTLDLILKLPTFRSSINEEKHICVVKYKTSFSISEHSIIFFRVSLCLSKSSKRHHYLCFQSAFSFWRKIISGLTFFSKYLLILTNKWR